jgi:hypothetical protein
MMQATFHVRPCSQTHQSDAKQASVHSITRSEFQEGGSPIRNLTTVSGLLESG